MKEFDMNTAELLKSVNELPAMERMEFVDMVLSTLSQSDAAVDTAWAEETERRIVAIDKGEISLLSADEVMAKYRKT
jgi:putative addiction module component (TIGR02574 family)